MLYSSLDFQAETSTVEPILSEPDGKVTEICYAETSDGRVVATWIVRYATSPNRFKLKIGYADDPTTFATTDDSITPDRTLITNNTATGTGYGQLRHNMCRVPGGVLIMQVWCPLDSGFPSYDNTTMRVRPQQGQYPVGDGTLETKWKSTANGGAQALPVSWWSSADDGATWYLMGNIKMTGYMQLAFRQYDKDGSPGVPPFGTNADGSEEVVVEFRCPEDVGTQIYQALGLQASSTDPLSVTDWSQGTGSGLHESRLAAIELWSGNEGFPAYRSVSEYEWSPSAIGSTSGSGSSVFYGLTTTFHCPSTIRVAMQPCPLQWRIRTVWDEADDITAQWVTFAEFDGPFGDAGIRGPSQRWAAADSDWSPVSEPWDFPLAGSVCPNHDIAENQRLSLSSGFAFWNGYAEYLGTSGTGAAWHYHMARPSGVNSLAHWSMIHTSAFSGSMPISLRYSKFVKDVGNTVGGRIGCEMNLNNFTTRCSIFRDQNDVHAIITTKAFPSWTDDSNSPEWEPDWSLLKTWSWPTVETNQENEAHTYVYQVGTWMIVNSGAHIVGVANLVDCPRTEEIHIPYKTWYREPDQDKRIYYSSQNLYRIQRWARLAELSGATPLDLHTPTLGDEYADFTLSPQAHRDMWLRIERWTASLCEAWPCRLHVPYKGFPERDLDNYLALEYWARDRCYLPTPTGFS